MSGSTSHPQAILSVTRGAREVVSFPLPRTALTLIGRHPSNQVVLPHPGVSLHHCLLAPAPEGSGFLVIDTRSGRPTLVNAAPAYKQALHFGDLITVGPFVLQLLPAPHQHAPSAGSAPPAARPALFELAVRGDPGRSHPIALDSATVLGRTPLAHVRLDDPLVSRFHLLVTVDTSRGEPALYLQDLWSRYGTFLGEEQVFRKHARAGDIVTLGDTEIQIRALMLWPAPVRDERLLRMAPRPLRAPAETIIAAETPPPPTRAPQPAEPPSETTELVFEDLPPAPPGLCPYEAFHGFKDRPFRLTADPDCFFRSRQHSAAVDALLAWIETGPPVAALTGEAGCGKSLLLACIERELAGRRPSATAFRASVAEITIDRLLRGPLTRAGELHPSVPSDGEPSLERWRLAAQRLRQGNQRVALLLDDAHKADKDLLAGLARLLDDEDSRTVTRILLAGGPTLRAHVAESPLASHLGAQPSIEALSRQEIGPYLGHRLSTAAGRASCLFTPQAAELVAAFSRGIPRTINVVADAALFCAFRARQRQVAAEHVSEAIRNVLGAELPVHTIG